MMGTSINGFFQKRVGNVWEKIYKYDDGFYKLYALLADVRNYHDIKPIALPKGLPEDLTAQDREWFNNYYSNSWLDDDELLTWYSQPDIYMFEGYMPYSDYMKWDKKTQPCAIAMGCFVPFLNMKQADEGQVAEYVEVFWQQDLREIVAGFFDEVVELKQQHGKIRFVFGFDS